MIRKALTALPVIALLAGLALTVSSCKTWPAIPVSERALEPYECGTIKRLHTHDGIFVASQPAEADLKHASEAGVKTVINLRKDGEIDWDERAIVEGLDMTYHSVATSTRGRSQTDDRDSRLSRRNSSPA